MQRKTLMNILKGSRHGENLPLFSWCRSFDFEELAQESTWKEIDRGQIIAVDFKNESVVVGYHGDCQIKSRAIINGREVVVSEIDQDAELPWRQ